MHLELRHQRPCPVGIAGRQRLDGHPRIREAPAGIQSRRQPEPDRPDRHALDQSDLLERDEARAGRSLELAQSIRHQNPVLVDQRHHVRHRPQGDEVEIPTEIRQRHVSSAAQLHPEPHQEVERDTRPRQSLEGELGVAPQRIQHRERRRPLGWSMMVITDDHVHAERPCKRQLGDVGRSEVRRDHHTRARGVEFPQRVGMQPVPLARTMGNVQQRISAELP